MNKNQKYVLMIGIIPIIAVLLSWIIQGAEIFTKTQILVNKTTDLDRMLGVEHKEYVDKFILGLLPSGIGSILELLSTSTFSGVIIIITGILIYLFRNKSKETT
jgi:hypothetical protein